MNEQLTIWTLFKQPSDFPRHYVMRKHFVTAGKTVPNQRCELFDSLAEARSRLPRGLHNLGRMEQDDPVIVESWI